MKLDSLSGVASRLPWASSPFIIGAGGIISIGFLLSVFDLLRKTVFLDASWNYNYLPFQFVYDLPALVALLILLAAAVVLFPRAVDLPPTRFAIGLFGFTVILFTLGLFALPLELTKALDVDKRGLYTGAVFLVQNGPLEFLDSFNQLKVTSPPAEHEHLYAVESLKAIQEDPAANQFAVWFSSLDWIPFNESIATYVSEYTTQKHGPMSVFMIAPFLLFGASTATALAGNILVVSVVPIVGYYTFRLYFSEDISRLGAVLLAVGPGLFIWTRHAAPVPYDAFTALFVGGTLFYFLRGIDTNERKYYVAAGVLLSLAALNKLTALVMALPVLLLLVREAPTVKTAVSRAAEMVGAWLLVPTAFLLAGYNFVAQYLYTVYKLTLYKIQKPGGDTSVSPDNPAAALEDPLIGLVGTLYNLRWMNVVFCVLAVVLIVGVLWNRDVLDSDKHVVSVALITAFLPFGVWVIFSSGTLSRHTIMLSIPLGFIACSGVAVLLEYSPDIDRHHLLRFGQAALLVSGLQFAINI